MAYLQPGNTACSHIGALELEPKAGWEIHHLLSSTESRKNNFGNSPGLRTPHTRYQYQKDSVSSQENMEPRSQCSYTESDSAKSGQPWCLLGGSWSIARYTSAGLEWQRQRTRRLCAVGGHQLTTSWMENATTSENYMDTTKLSYVPHTRSRQHTKN